MTTLEVLRGVRELLSESHRWTKGAPARGRDGTPLMQVSDPRACSWCMVGAAAFVSDNRSNATVSLLKAILNEHAAGNYIGLARWNDRAATTHAEVLALLDRAIAEAEKGGAK